MILDGCSFADCELITGDVCIIGGGPAGITIAHELASTNLKVILIESGSEGSRSTAEALSAGGPVSEGFAPLSLFRRRVLGGSSVIWAGRCIPFDPIDFDRREHVPLSGWPISYGEVHAYYQRASTYCEAGAADYHSATALDGLSPFIEGFSSNLISTTSYERFSPPTNFGKKYGPGLKACGNVVVLTNTTCVELVGEGDGSIRLALCATLSGSRLRVKAGKFVVAAGGLETYRLLANSTAPTGHSVGDSGGMLGRCLMSHLEGTVGTLVLDRPHRPVAWGFERSRDGIYGRRRMTIAPEVQRQRRTLNFTARLHHALVANPRHRDPILTAMFIVKKMLLPEYRSKVSDLGKADAVPKGAAFWGMHALNLAFGAPALARFSAGWFWRRHLVYRRIPYVVLQSRTGSYPLDVNGEESPNPRSRVYRTGTRDRFGARQIAVDWQPLDSDFASIATNCRIVRDAFAETGVARYDFDDDALDEDVRRCTPVGGHHMGVTRMSESPEEGVVDANCRVYGSPNLFVASASVFPTSSHANPTLTIVALSLRLADHLARLAKGGLTDEGHCVDTRARLPVVVEQPEVELGMARDSDGAGADLLVHLAAVAQALAHPSDVSLGMTLAGVLGGESGANQLKLDDVTPAHLTEQVLDLKTIPGGSP